MGANACQLPTSRKDNTSYLRPTDRPFQKRFVFMGHVKATKGIDIVLEALQQLDDTYTVHFYGPIKDKKYQTTFNNTHSNYQRLLQKEEVLPTLQEYDVLILPTYFSGEGYPGAIIEAYSLGLPVLTTHWKAIPEIVKHETTGYLIQPKSVEAFIEGIQFFNSDNYTDLSQNARNYFLNAFAAQAVTAKAWKEITDLWKD